SAANCQERKERRTGFIMLTRQYQNQADGTQRKSGINEGCRPNSGMLVFRFVARKSPDLYNLFSVVGPAEENSNQKGQAGIMRLFSRALLGVALLVSASTGWAQEKTSSPELTVAAAADLSTALKEIGDGYEKRTGVKLKLSF